MLDKLKDLLKINKKNPKERDRLTLLMEEKKAATKKKQSSVSVLNTHVQPLRGGFVLIQC